MREALHPAAFQYIMIAISRILEGMLTWFELNYRRDPFNMA